MGDCNMPALLCATLYNDRVAQNYQWLLNYSVQSSSTVLSMRVPLDSPTTYYPVTEHSALNNSYFLVDAYASRYASLGILSVITFISILHFNITLRYSGTNIQVSQNIVISQLTL